MIDFKFFKTNLEKFKTQVVKLTRDLETKKRRREDLDTLPLCKSDRIALLDAWVDRVAAAYPAALQAPLDSVFGSPIIPNHPDGETLVDLLSVMPHVGVRLSPAHFQKSLFFFFPDQFKAGFRKAIAAMPAVENEGPPMVERTIEKKKLDEQIAALEAELSELTQSALDAGLSL